MSEARRRVTALVMSHIAPVMKLAGFRKRGLIFERKRGEVTQLITIQLSYGGNGTFFVNVGLLFDAVAALGADPSGSIVIGGQAVHYSARIDDLVKKLPQEWTVTDDASSATVGTQVSTALTRVVALLDGIQDGATALSGLERALDKGFRKVVRAQLKYTTGDQAGARADLAAVAAEFADRQACTFADLAKRAGLRLKG